MARDTPNPFEQVELDRFLNLNLELIAGICDSSPGRVEAALGQGADPDFGESPFDIRTPLMHAAIRGDKTCVNILIHAGADVNRSFHNGHSWLSPLLCAIVKQHEDCVHELVVAGAVWDERDERQFQDMYGTDAPTPLE
jgi:ankyrin repeat protein